MTKHTFYRETLEDARNLFDIGGTALRLAFHMLICVPGLESVEVAETAPGEVRITVRLPRVAWLAFGARHRRAKRAIEDMRTLWATIGVRYRVRVR